MLKIKKAIKKWYKDFMIDPIYNATMYILFVILFIVMILLFIIVIKELIGVC